MKKSVQPEARPYCVQPWRPKRITNLKSCETRKRRNDPSTPARRNIVDCPFYTFKYKFDELPLDPAKAYIEEKIGKLADIMWCLNAFFLFASSLAHMQVDQIVGRCNKELDFHIYQMDHVKWEYEECDDDSLQELKLEDIVMPQKFEMLKDKKDHKYAFNSRGECLHTHTLR